MLENFYRITIKHTLNNIFKKIIINIKRENKIFYQSIDFLNHSKPLIHVGRFWRFRHQINTYISVSIVKGKLLLLFFFKGIIFKIQF